MLQVNNIDVAYGDAQVLFDVSLDIQEGELVTVIGANGAGKTTLLKTISGILRPKNGTIDFLENAISSEPPNRIVSEGIIQIPEGRLLFPKMTVRENLMMGAYLTRGKEIIEQRLDMVFDMFSILKDRESQLAGTLSGGEQQMLAVGRGLMAGPKLLMLDEPSLGLAPLLVQQVMSPPWVWLPCSFSKFLIWFNKSITILVLRFYLWNKMLGGLARYQTGLLCLKMEELY